MLRAAVLTNIHSSFNRRRLDRVRSRLSGGRIRHIECEDLAQMREVLPALDETHCDLLAINGGDGTVHLTLSAMRDLGIAAPVLALLPGGTTNMTAHDVNGRRMSFESALNSFLDAAASGRPPHSPAGAGPPPTTTWSWRSSARPPTTAHAWNC